MRVHHFQHVPFEDMGSMTAHFQQRGYEMSATHFYRGEPLPAMDEFDWLVVMGGPMGVYDTDRYPWLKQEREFIHDAIEAGKVVLGICLGAQLIAAALGAEVRPNQHREIGWFPLAVTADSKTTALGSVLPDSLPAFHWHGDTFELPPGAVHLARSEACENQAFAIDDRVFAFQFHLETTEASARALIEHCRDELDGSRYVQTAEAMMSRPDRFRTINRTMAEVLSAIENRSVPGGSNRAIPG